MKIELRDEQANVVTPRKGDYVMACDIDNEEMHSATDRDWETFTSA